jgi:hypothetical protein
MLEVISGVISAYFRFIGDHCNGDKGFSDSHICKVTLECFMEMELSMQL